MQGLQGRPAKRPSIEGVRELTLEEVRVMPRASVARVKALRDSHHMIARLLAIGLRYEEIAARTGYSYARIAVLALDPSIQDLKAKYTSVVDVTFHENVDVYFSLATSARVKSMRQMVDRLDEADEMGEKLPLN